MTSSTTEPRDFSFGDNTRLELAPPDMKKHVGHTLSNVEKQLIVSTLSRCGGNRTMAADILGISLLVLRDKLRDYAATPEGSMTSTEQKACDEDSLLTRLKDYDPGDSPPS